MAVIFCGLSPDEFWRLSWFEWQLYMIRLHERRREKEIDHHLMRMVASTVNNAFGGKAKPEDYIRLSFDKEEKPRVMTPEEVDQLIKKQNG